MISALLRSYAHFSQLGIAAVATLPITSEGEQPLPRPRRCFPTLPPTPEGESQRTMLLNVGRLPLGIKGAGGLSFIIQ